MEKKYFVKLIEQEPCFLTNVAPIILGKINRPCMVEDCTGNGGEKGAQKGRIQYLLWFFFFLLLLTHHQITTG
jgi:hypothetical protein